MRYLRERTAFRLGRRGLLLVLGIAALGVAAGVAIASNHNGTAYTGCLTSGGSIVNVAVGDDPANPCNGSSTQISWNAEGVQGPPGETGPEGPEGPEGPAGEPGAPANMVAFFTQGACPDGWSELADAQGRAIVGLPAGGTLGATVGAGMTDVQGVSHAHDHVSSDTFPAGMHDHGGETLAAAPAGSAEAGAGVLATGLHDHVILPDGPHDHRLPDTSETDGHLPYIQLLACEKD